MLEGLVAWVLNNYLGKYVENLNTDQLSVALLSGKVELENLPLKKDALRHLGLPVEIKAGFIGKVQLQVPVRQIRSAPWLIAIEKLYLVATPVNLDEWDGEAEARYAHERKVALLDALEAQWRVEHEAADAGYYATSYSSWLSYGTGLLANIVENLQLKLHDVHIRYEEAGGGFACGLTVAALAAESCDAEWRRGFTLLADPDGCSFKLLELQRLAVYWDPMPVPAGMLADCTISELTERMSETWKASHRYLVSPASAHARVRRERTEQPLRARARPRLAAHLTLDTVLLNLTSRQYKEAVGSAVGLQRLSRLRECRALRPAVPVRGHARLWWIYALSAHVPHHPWTEPAPTWESCLGAARASRGYVSACLATLAQPAATLPADVKAAKDEFEWRTPLHVLKPLREVAMRIVPKSSPVSTPDRPSSGRSMLVHWFPQWWGWYGPPTAPDLAPTPAPAPAPAPTPADLEEEILDVIADSLDNNTLLKRDTVFGKFEFVLNKGSLNLTMDDGDEEIGSGASSPGDCGGGAVELAFSEVRAEVESRPRGAAHAFHVSLGELCLKDRVTPRTLFPVICAPQGVIREALCALGAGGAPARCRAHNAPPPHAHDPLFQLSYEKRPLNANCDYKLWVKSGSIEVVYCPEVARWARGFVSAPWGASGVPALHAYHSVRDSTRATIMNHWEHIMRPGDRGERRSWQVELDISAPQILFAESLCSREAAVLLVDFGRLRLANAPRAPPPPAPPPAPPDEEEQFMTPCSTPPGSLLSPAEPPLASPTATLDAQNLHDRLYDRYEVELSSLQVLVGRARDNWQYAHTKPTSALHLLDRFSIALVAERRAVRTCDPGYPAATLQAHLPALVAHLSEHKLCSVRAVLANLPLQDLHSGQPAAAPGLVDDETSCSSETERSEAAHNSTLLMLQFMVDQMSLEVQSVGRSIAEVQVCGVRVSAARRPRDTSLSLSVHSLLLVDALQTYGPDFELLVASHKHVGMDTASGSILGSEPTSPTSPSSPHAPPTAHALSQALHALYHTHNYRGASEVDRASPAPSWVPGGGNNTAPSWGGGTCGGGIWGAGTWGAAGAAAGCNWGAAGLGDSEALIAVELCLVKGDADSEDLRIANILFNNLDIIANQETIVELIGFCQRVVGPHAGKPAAAPRAASPPAHLPAADMQKATRTEITFDFHRLGVLLLRAAVHEGAVVARKIATATVCEARIQATLDGSQVSTTGSLGGVHVVSLCEGGGVHARVLCAGTPASPHPAPLEALDAHHDEKALLFTVQRTVLAHEDAARPGVEASVVMKVARVWYTHSPALVLQLRSCLAEFKQYLANLARSIRAAAADMALGLVHPRESLYLNPRLSGSSEGVSPRRRTISLGASLDDPPDLQDNIVLSVSIELESPVVVVPRGAHSTQVLVAHLGRMSLSNRPGPPGNTLYTVRVRDISLASLDVAEKVSRLALTAESMRRVYDVRCGRPVLHNTALKLTLNLGDHHLDTPCQCVISGGVVGALQVSARRDQYEQLLDTLRWISGGTHPASDVHPAVPPTPTANMNDSSKVLEPAVPTLQLDPAVRAAVLAVPPLVPPMPPAAPPAPPPLPLIVNFELPMFSVELRADLGTGERSLVDLSFREFALSYKKTNEYETTLQVSLHSITMEDLTKEPESKHRMMMVSHTPQMPPKAVFVSKSCPDFHTGHLEDDLEDFSSLQYSRGSSHSLPSQLNVNEKKERRNKRQDSKCGPTPPCSPECCPAGEGSGEDDAGEGLAADDNLVWVWVHTRDPTHPRFRDKYNKVSKLTKVEFNCLNLVVSIDSWVTVLDFFGVAGDDVSDAPADAPPDQRESSTSPTSCGTTQTDVSVRSLSVVVVGARGEVCRALVSRVRVAARAEPALGARAISGRLGALVLADLTPRAPLWRDTLRTAHHQALTFQYNRLSAAEAAVAGHETSLKLEMGPVTYVHTRRFVHELQEFARDFSLLRRVITQARHKVSVASGLQESGRAARMLMRVVCEAPCIILPVSGRCRAALAAQLARLDLSNCFKHAGDPGTVSTLTDSDCPDRELLDVRSVQLSSLTLRSARGGPALRLGAPLLTEPAHLTLHIEQNLSQTHNVPDMTVHGTLTKLECALDPAQYRLVRGVLQHNLGEVVGEPHPPPPPHHCLQVWTTSSLKLELQDVALRLEPQLGQSSLACINFIKSRLVLDTYSDMTRDIDLVSQEILVSDTRYANEPANRRGNVFTNIVQPMPDHRHSVQAEVHARTHREYSAYTILVNNMRLMAVLEWWERAHQFLTQPPHAAADGDQPPLEEASPVRCGGAREEPPAQMELKLNITDSQLVLVEDASVWDTNAVILRSTTVITYRLADPEKPISCSLNELEVFSCVLGLEEETALSIVEPAALHVVLDAQRVLHVSTSTLDLRLSYHDMRMFASMLQSLPVQARAALSGNAVTSEVVTDAPANSIHMQAGAGPPPRWAGAPRWLRAVPPPAPPAQPAAPSPVWPLKAVQVTAECITLCVIDDCLDSDVPLLEVALTDLQLEQDLRKVEEAFEDPVLVSTPCAAGGGPRAAGAGGGRLGAVLSVDYYNRTLSGWEPCVEPWRFETTWEYTLSSVLSLARVQVSVTSSEMLNTTVTSSLLSLWQLVRANWAADYYAPQTSSGAEQSPKGSPAGHRRRSPFVPYALRNHTGHRLWFTTLITTSDVLREQTSWSGPDDSWQGVRAGDTEPFSFGGRRGARAAGGGRSHAHQLHQLALRLDGWDPPDPVCVDRVGVFFRNLTHSKTGAEARIVFEVSLEGSARKLVTVRSALQLVNKLPHAVEVRVDHAPSHESPRGCCMRRQVRVACASLQRARALRAALAAPPPASRDTHPMFVNCAQWTGSGVRIAQVPAGGAWAAPLSARPGVLWTRPLVPGAGAPPAPAPIDWRAAGPLVHHECRAPPDHVYRFCCVIVRERFPADKGPPVAGHTLTLVPALRLENLLPLELQYRLSSAASRVAAAPPADTVPFHQVNVEEGVELSVKLEGFGWSTPLSVGVAGGGGSFSARLKLRDTRGRRLYLNARVTMKKTDGIKVSISAPYWLVNRTGLPLVFRAEGAAGEAAGQFAEHEVARMVAPLLFSFAEAAGPTLAARLGHGLPGTPEWCSPFGLGPGVGVKKLEVRGEGEGAERVFAVGVSVRSGRARYRHTNIVTFTPRYQLHNNTTHHLQFAQKCTATTLKDPGAMATHVSAVAGCYLPWHWARWERPHLLCVRLLGAGPGAAPATAWSAGFRVDTARSLTVPCREAGGGYQFVRVEVAAQGATLFVVLTDGETAPPPLAIHNYSPVSIMFHQVGCSEECAVGAHGSVRWALPEPEGAAALALRAPGGPRTTLPLAALGSSATLLYQNFIYVAFTATHHRDSPGGGGGAASEGALVLEVPLGSTRVVLARKRYGDRCQLWRRGPNEQLIHEGSSVPQSTDVLLADDAPLSPHSMVLDIEDAAPRPGRASWLVLRRADGRRASTQAWRLLRGRMCCAHSNLCVQPDSLTLQGLQLGGRVVLGMVGGGIGGAAPAEQAVSWHTLRPGSGRLAVSLAADGPTRRLTIRDQKDPESGWLENAEECEEGAEGGREWGVAVSLAGLSVSVVARVELVHAVFSGLALAAARHLRHLSADLRVTDMQWDNQLLGTTSPVLLCCVERGGGAALHAALELQRAAPAQHNAYCFKHLCVAARPVAVRLEERLILQLWWWAWGEESEGGEQPDEAEFETRRMLDELTALHATRYYFALIKIMPSQIRLSMTTASKLEGSLSALKRRLGLTLIKFEDACVELEPLERHHVYDTASYLTRQMYAHFKDELKWQAAKILGSVDFLGNPLGFVADVSEGVSGLLLEGNVAALLQNVTHGLSNSAAKVSESLGDGLERVVGDEAHGETRRRIRSEAGGAHLAAGLRHLSLGLLGGATSLVKHSYEGAAREGLAGFLAGVGKGLVGTVTKPVIGVLDLAADTAAALRDSSRRADRRAPARVRGPRCAAGAGGLLPRYCGAGARGAALLYQLNEGDHSERFLAYRLVRDTPHDIRALLSDAYVRMFTCKHGAPHVLMETHLSNLVSCCALEEGGASFVELGVRGGGGEAVRRPRVQCDSPHLAAWVARHAALARQLYHEHVHTLHPHTDM